MGKNTTNVIPFKFDKQEVRTLMIDDEPWFVAKDIIGSLGYAKSSSPAKLIEHVPDQWKGVNPIHTLGGIQNLLMLSEQGLYFFLGRSDKSKALPFQMWIAGEVLPAIRKHGRYEDIDNRMETLIGQTIGTDGFHMLGSLVKGKVSSLPVTIRRRATTKIWAQTHAAFGVRCASDIPADQLDSARNFIAAYALEGEWLPRRDTAIPESLSVAERYMVYADHNGMRQITAIPPDAYVLSQKEMIKGMTTPGNIPVSTEDMFEFAIAALVNLKSRSEHQTQRVSHLSSACKQNGVKI